MYRHNIKRVRIEVEGSREGGREEEKIEAREAYLDGCNGKILFL